MTEAFTEPTSDTMQPGFKPGLMASATVPQTPTGTQRITRSASLTPAATSVVASSAIPSSRTRSTTASLASAATMERARLRCLAARAIDEPIRPRPTRATRSKSGVSREEPRRSGIFPAHEITQSRHHETIRLLVAHGQAQRVRQAVSIDPAQDEPAAGEEGIGVLRGQALFLREVDQQEIADARRDLQAQSHDFAGEPGEPSLVVLDRLREMSLVLDRRDAGRHGRAADVERPPNAIDRVSDMSRRHHPAEAQVREAVDLREGAGHH